MKNVEINERDVVVYEIGGTELYQHIGPDMINVSDMCEKLGGKLPEYYACQESKAYLRQLSEERNCSPEQLIRCVDNGNPEDIGTWFDWELAEQLKQWIFSSGAAHH